MLQLLILLQARLVWSFFTESTQCLKPWQQNDMISRVKLSISKKKLTNSMVLMQTLNRLFYEKHLFPFVYLLHVHITCTNHV